MNRARILVVQDDSLSRPLVHDLLELRGHEVIEAANADEARTLLDIEHLDTRTFGSSIEADLPGACRGG
ncbi:MAG TPA: hypothetical protein VFH68_27390 [Polyangia bacterium]|nr:hypothetical protein [Polyangia bacterium]